MKTFIENTKGFDIYFEALEEHIPLSELLPDYTENERDEIYQNSAIFCASVIVEKLGIKLSTQYLGGCIYDNEEDFYTKFRSDYFDTMVYEGIEEARKMIKKLAE